MRIPYAGGEATRRMAVLRHYRSDYQDVYLRRIALSKEKELTILGILMVLMTLLSILSLIYDIVISVRVENAYDEIWEKKCTGEEIDTFEYCFNQVYWQLRLISRVRIISDVMFFLTILITWLNHLRMDIYLFSLPFSFISFAIISIFMAYQTQSENVLFRAAE